MTGKDLRETNSLKKNTIFYVFFNTAIIFIFPVISIAIEKFSEQASLSWILIGKWFVFWAVGFRLFTAGIKQASDPAFTATKIFKINNKDVYEIVRELGFANICLGIGGILSLINNEWRQIIAILGCLFFGLAGIRHLAGKIITGNQKFAMISDLVIFLILLLYTVYTLR